MKNRREKGGRKGNGRVQQQVRVEELLDPKGCNNGRRNRTGFSSSVLFGRIPDRGSQYKGGTDRLENRCIAITSHFSFYYFFFSLSLPLFFFFFSRLYLSPIWMSDQNDENVPCFRLNNSRDIGSRKDKELVRQFDGDEFWSNISVDQLDIDGKINELPTKIFALIRSRIISIVNLRYTFDIFKMIYYLYTMTNNRIFIFYIHISFSSYYKHERETKL